MIEHLIPEWLKNHHIVRWAAVGSRVTCNPAPVDTDADFLIHLAEKEFEGNSIQLFREELEHWGWEIGGSMPLDADHGNYPPETKFTSFTRGEINLIVTENALFFQRFMASTAVCKRLNLLEKADRIAVFQAVLYTNTTEPVHCNYPAFGTGRAAPAPAPVKDEINDLI